MKLFIICLLLSGKAFSQSTFVNDTLTYNNKNYVVGDTVTLSYGSGNNKNFAFVQLGGGFNGKENLAARYSKTPLIIDKIIQQGYKYFLRCKFLAHNIAGAKVFVDLEGAVDNKEML